MISADLLSQDDIMEMFEISRGNVNMNIRDLIDWGTGKTCHYSGGAQGIFLCRKKDIWKVATKIVKERKKKRVGTLCCGSSIN